VFQAEDPGDAVVQKSEETVDDAEEAPEAEATPQEKDEPSKPDDAGIRIDLTRIGGQK